MEFLFPYFLCFQDNVGFKFGGHGFPILDMILTLFHFGYTLGIYSFSHHISFSSETLKLIWFALELSCLFVSCFVLV